MPKLTETFFSLFVSCLFVLCRNRVVSGLVSPAALSRMTAKELASSELAHLREEIRKDAVKMVRPAGLA